MNTPTLLDSECASIPTGSEIFVAQIGEASTDVEIQDMAVKEGGGQDAQKRKAPGKKAGGGTDVQKKRKA